MQKQNILSSLELNKTKIMREIEQKKKRLREQSSIQSDSADESIEENENRAILNELLRDERKLRSIEEAEIANDEGHYGYCQKCHKKITAKRLKAIPLATLCLKCSET